ncbi:MAG: hypothetical protein JEY99_08410 [Spirochaetales bacterium]|nr:hypothetical protein [Spirochaetales bacterium]
MGANSKHRLNQKDLVTNIFGFFSEEYEQSSYGSIWDIKIPVENMIRYLKDKCDVSYKSELWVWTQLKRYEEELGVKLFRKVRTGEDNKGFSLALNYPYINFFQKKHLYVNEKIKVANGIHDKILDYTRNQRKKGPVRIFLGAGTLCYHFSTIIAEPSETNRQKYLIHTNNLGALTQLIAPGLNNHNIEVIVPEGRVDPVTYTITGEEDCFSSVDFDFIIQGTSWVHNGELFIESADENIRKKAILQKSSGQKILALTKKEFSSEPVKNSESYGKILDYDFVVVPKQSGLLSGTKKYEELFEAAKLDLTPEILNWNYEIYKVNK